VTALLEYFNLEWQEPLLDNIWQLPESFFLCVFKQCKVDGSMGSAPSQEVIFEKNDNNEHVMRVPRQDACEE